MVPALSGGSKLVIAILILFVVAAVQPLRAATPPTAFIEKPVATGLINPTAMAFAPDGRLFVCQQAGPCGSSKTTCCWRRRL